MLFSRFGQHSMNRSFSMQSKTTFSRAGGVNLITKGPFGVRLPDWREHNSSGWSFRNSLSCMVLTHIVCCSAICCMLLTGVVDLTFTQSFVIHDCGRAWAAQTWLQETADMPVQFQDMLQVQQCLVAFSHFIYIKSGGTQVHFGFQSRCIRLSCGVSFAKYFKS